MFNYVKVTFPETTKTPTILHSATLYQNRYEHEIVVLKFKDWGIEYDAVQDGTPVQIDFIGSANKTKSIFGYVHHIRINRSPGKFFTEVTVIGASYLMKQQGQSIYYNTTADAVVKQIAQKYGFAVSAEYHPRVYQQIAQAGHTDWELLVRLAKQCGYTLRATNTELYFQPMLKDYTDYRKQANYFVMRTESDVNGSTIYSFNSLIGQSLQYEDGVKAAIAVSGMDKSSSSPVSITQQIRNAKTRTKSKPEVFNRFATDVVAPDSMTAAHEAKAAEDRASFPYRARVEVLGEPDLRPDMPVYLDGLGSDYTGYWIILGAEHKITTTESGAQTYTTVLTVGTDSLGKSTRWSDGQIIEAPSSHKTRTIIPNVKQTNVVPRSTLVTTYNSPSPSTKASLSVATNRPLPSVDNRAASASYWKSKTYSLSSVLVSTDNTPPTVKERYRKVSGLGL